jgi:hypothetical protein
MCRAFIMDRLGFEWNPLPPQRVQILQLQLRPFPLPLG